MESLSKVLYSYGVRANKIDQVTPNVFRIEDGGNVYALKKSSLTKNNLANWEQVFHEAYHHKLTNVLPVYMTKKEALFNNHSNIFYYLSPWVYEQGDKSVDKLYEAIGSIHSKTRYNHTVKKESFIRKFEHYQAYCEQAEENLRLFVEQFEAQHYMAPVELQVCTHFRDVELAIRLLKQRVENFIEDQKTDQEEWSFSLCHGYLSFDHFLSTLNDQYFINWENSSYNYPVFDLVHLFKHEAKKYHAPAEEMINNFTVYMDINTLSKNELNFMLIYLLDPATYIVEVEQYLKNNYKSMIEITKNLQKQYRILRFGIELSHFIEREYERPTFAEPNES